MWIVGPQDPSELKSGRVSIIMDWLCLGGRRGGDLSRHWLEDPCFPLRAGSGLCVSLMLSKAVFMTCEHRNLGTGFFLKAASRSPYTLPILALSKSPSVTSVHSWGPGLSSNNSSSSLWSRAWLSPVCRPKLCQREKVGFMWHQEAKSN